MPFLSEEQQMIRDMVREFAEAELAPQAARLDAERRFPSESIPKLAALDLLGLTVTEDYGGAGVDALSYVIALEEVARACASTALVLLAHNSLAAMPLQRWGTEEQRKRWLVPLAQGEKLGAFALAEPEAGSDALALRTAALRRDGVWVLNGDKAFVTNASHAGVFIVVARTDPEARGEAGLAFFVVERDTPGLVIDDPDDGLGLRAAGTGPLHLRDVLVPGANRLGCESEETIDWRPLLDEARLGFAALAVGLAQGTFERALAYARERPQFERPIADFEAIQWRLADMATEVHAARLVVHDAVRMLDAGQGIGKQSAMAKLFATETAMRAADHAVQIHGGYGYTREYVVERHYRDAKVTEIAFGTSEMQRLAIARAVLREADAGLPLLH